MDRMTTTSRQFAADDRVWPAEGDDGKALPSLAKLPDPPSPQDLRNQRATACWTRSSSLSAGRVVRAQDNLCPTYVEDLVQAVHGIRPEGCAA